MEKLFYKLDTIITILLVNNDYNKIKIYLNEVIGDLDIIIANLKYAPKIKKSIIQNE
jgi:hypothetical protein